ncbi:hypothetical protein [Mucilaginibacter psychrotolerans]|uniref:Haem-binding uptake Tiki superfamily ChaN domain-containing protein n=1 Tax=Mucilaginibacter psychrotolerans TaxID=1524096 RepID=A0A4Y8SGK6_9SPHI|nr:hypothetical protein [Mucilaginibacter psychrotolerans]TFF37546.1 hypothetical protein E2R66_12185 [Mucilaginibacter psychrotolerans]
MKSFLLALIMCLPLTGFAQAKKPRTDLEKLNDCIAANTSSFTFNGNQPEGKAWQVLEDLFAQNQFVAWGEYHGSAKLSQLTALAMASANQQGYKTFCVETSPFVAAELKRIAAATNPADTLDKIFKAGYPGIGTFPFFRTKEDAEMLLAANKFGFDIWGIDQEFQMCFSYGMNQAYNAQSKKTKAAFKPVIDSLQARWWYPETKLLDSLKKVVRQPKFRALLDDIKISKEIYRNSDNEGRAALMKSNFFRYYDKAASPKVFFKMGSNHLAKGINLQTNQYDIGNAVYELAQRQGQKFANVYIMVRYTTEKDSVVDDLTSDNPDNPKVFSQLYAADRWVLVDIRSLRIRLKYDDSLTRDAYSVIEKYDYVLVSPEVLKN